MIYLPNSELDSILPIHRHDDLAIVWSLFVVLAAIFGVVLASVRIGLRVIQYQIGQGPDLQSD